MVVIAGDAKLLSLGRRNAQAEIDKLYRRHSDEVLRYVLLVLRSRPDAEDVVQTTFMRAYRALERGERVQKPRNWLIKIAHNECRRALQVRSRRAVEVELRDVPSEPPVTGQAEQLRRAMSQLAAKQREALVLRELEGRTYAEIAVALGLSESAVETLIFRARRALREQLEGTLGCEEAANLLACESVAAEDRKRLRGHLRGCVECATLERKARGRKGALKRLASSFGLPWSFKAVAIALTVSTVSAVAVVAAPAEHAGPVGRDVTPQHVDKAQVPPVRAAAVTARSVAPRPVRHATRHRPTQTGLAGPAAAPHIAPVAATQARHVAVDPDTQPAEPSEPVAPSGQPADAGPSSPAARTSAPTAPATPVAPQPAKPTLAVPPVEVQVPAITVPPVEVPHVELPPVAVPPVTVTVPAVSVTVPTPPVPPLPVLP